MDIPTFLAEQGKAVESLLEAEIPRDSVRFVSEGVWYQFSTGGKRLRPALCLMSCEVFGGEPQRVLPFALATEILHNYLLIHDDIEDGDTMRRDQATLWVRQGIPNALNVGDYLIAKAYDLILGAPLPAETNLRLAQAFSLAFLRTVEGQALDINLRGSLEVTLDAYFDIVQRKTAYYLALTWVGGAIAAGVESQAIDQLWELGHLLGPAFQIRDDVIDLTEGKGRGGEIGCDIREGKPSVLFAYCVGGKQGTDSERERLVSVVARPREQTTDEDIRWAIDFYKRVGAVEFAQVEAKRLASEAIDMVDRLPVSESGKQGFREMTRFIIDRKF